MPALLPRRRRAHVLRRQQEEPRTPCAVRIRQRHNDHQDRGECRSRGPRPRRRLGGADSFFLGVFDKPTGEFVGQAHIGPISWDLPEFQIGYFVDKGHEGQGYATEAAKGALRFIFDHLKAHRVRLECDETNVRSRRVAERCGMTREGCLRENKKNPDGTFSATLVFGILRSEFEERY